MIIIQNVTKYRMPPHRILRTAAELALTAKLPLETIQTIELCIRVVGNEESAALNARYRHKNKPTNVLAFTADDPIPIALQDANLGAELTRDLNFFDPKNSKEYPGYFEGFSGQKNSKVDVKSDAQVRILKCNGYIHLGDIVLCVEVIKQEARDYGKTILSHVSHLVIHGTLHLLGFDHQTEKEAHVMESLETQFLQQLGFKDPY